jgi:hypothetical protein
MLTEEQLQKKANEAAGNWQKFDCFIWDHDAQPEDSENWCIVNLRTRDSEAVDRANARAITAAMDPFIKDGTAKLETFKHWAVGWMDAIAVKVFDNEKVTPAFTMMCELEEKMSDYPVLDDDLLAEEEAEDDQDEEDT